MLYNLKRCYTATIGTGTLTIGAAILNDFSDIPDGTIVSYSIIQGSLSAGFDAEVGRGTYSAGTLARDTVLSSTSGGAKIALDGTAQVVVTALAEDFVSFSGGVVGQVAAWSSTDTITSGALIPPASNILTLTNAAASTLALNIGSGKALTLTAADNYTVTIPASLTVAGLGIANVFTAIQKINVNSTTALLVEQDGVKNNTFIVDTTNGYVGVGAAPAAIFDVHSPNGGANKGIRLILDAQNGTASSSYVGIDFTVPTSGLIGQFLVSANNYANASVNLPTNSMAFLSYNLNGTLLLGAVGGRGEVVLNTGGVAPANERMRIVYTGEVGIGITAPLAKLHTSAATTTTNAVKEVQRIEATVSTAATGGAAGFGVGQAFYAETATDGTSQQQARIASSWVDATNATRKAKLVLSAYDTAIRTGLEIEATGSDVTLLTLGKLAFTQTDLNEYIDSLADGYIDYRATTGHRFGDGTNSLNISATGDLTLTGTATVFLDQFVDGLSLRPGASAPTFDVFQGGIWANYFVNGATDEAHGSLELQHDYKDGSSFDIHIHWSPDTVNVGNCRWNFEYTVANMSTGTFGATTTLTVDAATAGTAYQHLYTSLGTISGTGRLVGDVIMFRVYRAGTHANDTYTGRSALLRVACHYESDKMGSPT